MRLLGLEYLLLCSLLPAPDSRCISYCFRLAGPKSTLSILTTKYKIETHRAIYSSTTSTTAAPNASHQLPISLTFSKMSAIHPLSLSNQTALHLNVSTITLPQSSTPPNLFLPTLIFTDLLITQPAYPATNQSGRTTHRTTSLESAALSAEFATTAHHPTLQSTNAANSLACQTDLRRWMQTIASSTATQMWTKKSSKLVSKNRFDWRGYRWGELT